MVTVKDFGAGEIHMFMATRQTCISTGLAPPSLRSPPSTDPTIKGSFRGRSKHRLGQTAFQCLSCWDALPDGSKRHGLYKRLPRPKGKLSESTLRAK